MRYVLALFDAPFPLRRALASLQEDGLSPDDVAVVVAPAPASEVTADARSFEAAIASLAGELRALGVPEGDAHDYAEGVARGACLVAVRAPSLDAHGIAEVLGLGAPELAEYRRRWQANPGLIYHGVASDD